MSPDFVERFADVQRMFAGSLEWNLVVEVDSEDTCMVMRSLSVVAVFPASVISDVGAAPEVFAESLKEFLQMRLVEAPALGKIGVIICERHEAVVVVQVSFVQASDCPIH